MDYVMLLAFSAIVAIFANAIAPKLSANSTVSQYTNSYAGKTALSAVVIFASIVGASFLMGIVSKKALTDAKTAV